MDRFTYFGRLSVFLFTASSLAQSCYWPDGSLSSDVPCNLTADSPPGTVSACCTSAGMCLDNGVCFYQGKLVRGGCTAKEGWPSPCVQYCKDNRPDSGFPFTACDNDGNFACDLPSSGACNASSPNFKTFKMEGGAGFMLRPYQIHESSGLIVLPNSTLQLANSTAGAISVTTPSATNSATAVSSSSASTSSTTSPAAQNESTGYTPAILAAALVAVGVPLALALAGAIFVIVKQRKQIRTMERISSSGGQSHPHMSGYSSGPGAKTKDGVFGNRELEVHR